MGTPDNGAKRRFGGRQKCLDRLAGWGIALAGLLVIAAMFAMLALMVLEAAPLFKPATQREVGLSTVAEADAVVALATESDLSGQTRVAGLLFRDGGSGRVIVRNGESEAITVSRPPFFPEGTVRSVEPHGNSSFSLLGDDGTLSLVAFAANFKHGANAPSDVEAGFVRKFSVRLDMEKGEPAFAMLRGSEDNYRAVAVYSGGTIVEKSLRPGKGLRAGGRGVATERSLVLERKSVITSAALDGEGTRLYLGTADGDIVSVEFPADAAAGPAAETTPAFRDRRSITALSFLNGGYALAVGDERGGVSVWFPRRENGVFRLRRSVEWPGAVDAVESFAASGRNRGFISLDSRGRMRWLYSTTGNELLAFPAAGHPVALALNSRADSLATLRSDGALCFYRLDEAYPEAGWKGYFKRLLYEGYERAAFVWQSTGSDASEPKLSLVPLIWGSVKAAVYALLFATPIAVAAAMYLSQFAHPVWRARLKPAVEMVAAVPSVVIGFLAALWLAPLLEQYLQFFTKNYQYDQRNSLVIAIAMGFAVIPMVFSLAEDALSAVPPSLAAASLALGASKWQTVRRVVLPSAGPGIFTAVMLGFGRAVGETMIVLMAAGNTPVISLSPFNGMRTLSANIAVEMPEAPVGGTLYRTLFLCALILFALTLIVNTAAEIFRHRLRRRYGRL